MKHNYKNNKFFNSKKYAFSLIELLVVIAILGILFITLISRVDFAVDKAKTTGVQTQMHSYQLALTMISRESDGFNSYGWDMGDKPDPEIVDELKLKGYDTSELSNDAGDRVRNSYDEGDLNLNGIIDDGETWNNRKFYTETWTDKFTLVNPGNPNDYSAIEMLSLAINSKLDHSLHITINPITYEITTVNNGKDTWGNNFHGYYFTNAHVDGKDRGAIIIYSDGPNGRNGSEHTILNGIVNISVPNENVLGKDDLSICTFYSLVNGLGETKTITSGFSVNQ